MYIGKYEWNAQCICMLVPSKHEATIKWGSHQDYAGRVSARNGRNSAEIVFSASELKML